MLEEDDSDDSLELLLDTLCNAFGGIILITLLIALMSQEAHEAVIPPKNFRTQTLIQEQKILRMEGEIVIIAFNDADARPGRGAEVQV